MQTKSLINTKQFAKRTWGCHKRIVGILCIILFAVFLMGCGSIQGNLGGNELESSTGVQDMSEAENKETVFDKTLEGEWIEADGWRLTITGDGVVYYSSNSGDNHIDSAFAGTIEENAIIFNQYYSKGDRPQAFEQEEDIPESYFDECIRVYSLTRISTNSIQIVPIEYGTPSVLIRSE